MLCVLGSNSGRCRSLGASGGHPDHLSDSRHMTPCSDVVIYVFVIILDDDLGRLARADVRKRRGTLANLALKFYDLLDLEDPPQLHDCPVELSPPSLTTGAS